MITPQHLYSRYRLVRGQLHYVNGKPVTTDYIQVNGQKYKQSFITSILQRWLDNNRPAPVTLSKQYITKAGYPVKLFAIIGEHEPIKGIVEYAPNNWASVEWDLYGFHPSSDHALVPYEPTISETE